MLACIPIHSGMHIAVPAGTVHVITAGAIIYEVSERTQVTFRLFDWGRKPERRLDIDNGVRAVLAGVAQRADAAPESGVVLEENTLRTIVRFRTFRVSIATARHGRLNVAQARSTHLLTPLNSRLRFLDGGQLWESNSIDRYSSVLVPAVSRGYIIGVEGEVLVVSV